MLEETLTTSPDTDHTLRILVRDLESDTTYYYRFIAADGATSRLGRTWAAPSPRRNDPSVSMLGISQKQWFKDALAASQATWKVWANAEPVMGFRFDAGWISPEAGIGFLWTDSWDGFPNEREELMRFIRGERVFGEP